MRCFLFSSIHLQMSHSVCFYKLGWALTCTALFFSSTFVIFGKSSLKLKFLWSGPLIFLSQGYSHKEDSRGTLQEKKKQRRTRAALRARTWPFSCLQKSHNSKDFCPTPQLFRGNVFDTDQKNNTRALHEILLASFQSWRDFHCCRLCPRYRHLITF